MNRHLHGFLDRLSAGAIILELGCGGGKDASAMLDRGFNVIPTDGVREIARNAEDNIGKPVRVMRFDQLTAIEAFDAVWASASLLHVPRAELISILGRIHRAVKGHGLHFASYKAGATEGRDSFGRYFNFPSLDWLLKAYAASGDWTVVAADEYIGGGYEGGTGPWVAVTLQRN